MMDTIGFRREVWKRHHFDRLKSFSRIGNDPPQPKVDFNRMKFFKYLIFLILLSALYSIQPWSYNYRGFDEVHIQIAGGELALELVDQVRSKNSAPYCLYSRFKTSDKSGEPITIQIERIGTKANLEVNGNFVSSGKTFSIKSSTDGDSYSLYTSDGIPKLVLKPDEALDVFGAINYKGVSHKFETTLKIRHWQKSREVIKFCL
ncbi:hypothetical protein BH11PSE11_BH11PSE11_27370 [soil metagenome]